MNALKRSDSPERREKMREYGIKNDNDERMAIFVQEQKGASFKANQDMSKFINDSYDKLHYGSESPE